MVSPGHRLDRPVYRADEMTIDPNLTIDVFILLYRYDSELRRENG